MARFEHNKTVSKETIVLKLGTFEVNNTSHCCLNLIKHSAS